MKKTDNTTIDIKTIKGLIKRIDSLEETVSELNDKINELENNINKPKKERKPMSAKEKAERMKTRARSLIGKKVNGWTITGDKLDVVATKPGKKEIRVSGMKKRDEFEEMLK